jgi:2,4-dienoyl-CoA reductase-like NADH-dependent reductase (Old Yellow Enzyme family)/thioredoxin reductase
VALRIAIPSGLPVVPRDYVGAFDEAGRERMLRPGSLGPVDLRCRVILPAMESNLGTRDGFVTPDAIAYYGARADGGVGLVITENTSVHPSGLVAPGMLRIETDEQGAAFAPLADRIHDAGAAFFIQLSHAGRQTLSSTTGTQPWGASTEMCPIMKEPPREMTDADIRMLIAAFAAGAVRAQRAGADGVELHMAHGYLLCGFLSPDQNRRNDEWGGDTERRCAFPTAVVRSIRAACGDSFAVQCRISADEYVEGGILPDEAVRIAERLVAAGATSLHVSACNYESMFWNIPTYFLPEAPFSSLAGRVREATGVPVVAVGRIHRPEVAARVLETEADFVAMGRALIADPMLVKRVREGHPERIRPCLACNRCIASINGHRLECSVNPTLGLPAGPLGQESDARIGRGVVVVGGGISGLASALHAHELGRRVLLIERSDVLGGQLDIAAMVRRAERDGGLEIVTGRGAQRSDLDGADELIWAAGSRPTDRRFPGDDALPRVALDDALREPSLVGARPLVVGAGPGGAEGAHHLARLGAQVILVEKRRKIGMGLIPSLRYHLVKELEADGVRCFTAVKELRFDGTTAEVELRKRGTHYIEGVTAIVLAAGRHPIPMPLELTEGWTGTVHKVGDASHPASMFEALTAASKLP